MKIRVSLSNTLPSIRSEEPTDAIHYGDFGIGYDTTRKNMDSGRGTGHFGTGVYFMSEKANSRVRGSRPAVYLDVSKLNMIKVRDNESAEQLHTGSRALLRASEDYVDDGIEPDFDSYSSIARKALFNISIVLGFHKEKEIKKAMIKEIHKEKTLPNTENRTIFTRVMTDLGYDGVDTRYTNYDNGDYGSVLFVKA